MRNDSVALSDPDYAPEIGSSSGGTAPLRRSTRVRKKPTAPSLRQRSPPASIRLEQVALQTASALGLSPTCAAARLRVRMHPVAAAMISVHAHLTRTEVIGYLGGAVHETTRDNERVTDIIIAEAFPAQCLPDRTLARTGRSAYTEVEISPESSVEVVTRVALKGLSVVGWYHSHPDARFTVEPSRVDIENQHNYQTYMFKEAPFVAAIIAPYNEQLPDHNPDLQFFYVHGTDVPLQVPCLVEPLADVPAHVMPAEMVGCHRPFPLDSLLAESFNLVSSYATFAKRVRLHDSWRDDVTGVQKLQRALLDLVRGIPKYKSMSEASHSALLESGALQSDVERFEQVIRSVISAIGDAWSDSRLCDEERNARNREARKKKRKRK